MYEEEGDEEEEDKKKKKKREKEEHTHCSPTNRESSKKIEKLQENLQRQR